MKMLTSTNYGYKFGTHLLIIHCRNATLFIFLEKNNEITEKYVFENYFDKKVQRTHFALQTFRWLDELPLAWKSVCSDNQDSL